MLLLTTLLMIGSTTSYPQNEGLRDFTSAKDDVTGEWKYPGVRRDVTILKDKAAADVFHVEQKLAFVAAEKDSLDSELMVEKARNDRKWYDNLELGMIVGSIIAILIQWGMGQTAP